MKNDLLQTEKKRFQSQIKVDNEKTRADRYRMGQFSTPRELADEILEYSKTLNKFDEINFIDPAFGTGSFYTSVLKTYGNKVKSSLGFEIDDDYFRAAKNTWQEFNKLNIINSDFTKENESNYKKYNLLICNPPYSRHHEIDTQTKSRLKQVISDKLNYKISGLSGLHIYFMLLSEQWMAKDGLSLWLIPSEIFEVNYGEIIRKYLLNNVDLVGIHFFDQSSLKFSDALVSSCVVAFKHGGTNPDRRVKISFGDSVLHPSKQELFTKPELAKQRKWSKHLALKDNASTSSHKKEYLLGDYFDVKRGIATGDNNFFILEKEKAQALDIPKKYLINILPSSRYIQNNEVNLDHDGFLKSDKKLVILDIDLPLEEIRQLYPKLYLYLSEGIESGVNKKYLTSRRKPWYSQEKRNPPAYFIRYMIREREGLENKSILIKNNTNAVATNSYLLLYQKQQTKLGQEYDEKLLLPGLIRKLSENLSHLGRTYGGGLVKFEPGELKRILLQF